MSDLLFLVLIPFETLFFFFFLRWNSKRTGTKYLLLQEKSITMFSLLTYEIIFRDFCMFPRLACIFNADTNAWLEAITRWLTALSGLGVGVCTGGVGSKYHMMKSQCCSHVWLSWDKFFRLNALILKAIKEALKKKLEAAAWFKSRDEKKNLWIH